MTNLTILNNSIRQLDGLYSLNDLHKASGMEDKHKPVFFLRTDQTQELVNEIKGADMHLLPVNTTKGRNGGTYVCKELVYAYAMWISPKFHLMVIRAFDQLVAGYTQRSSAHYIPDFTKPPIHPARLSKGIRQSLQIQAHQMVDSGISYRQAAKKLNIKHFRVIPREISYLKSSGYPVHSLKPLDTQTPNDQSVSISLTKDEYIQFLEYKLSKLEQAA